MPLVILNDQGNCRPRKPPVWLADLQQQLLCQQKTSTLVWMLLHSSTLIVMARDVKQHPGSLTWRIGQNWASPQNRMDSKPTFYKYHGSLRLRVWPTPRSACHVRTALAPSIGPSDGQDGSRGTWNVNDPWHSADMMLWQLANLIVSHRIWASLVEYCFDCCP